MIAFLSLERFSRVGGGQEKEGGGKKNFIRLRLARRGVRYLEC